MAKEKFIHGKRDNCNHDGLASNTRRLQAAQYHEQHWQEELIEMAPGILYTLSNYENLVSLTMAEPAKPQYLGDVV